MYSRYYTYFRKTVKRMLYTCFMDEITPRRGPAPTKHIDILWSAAKLFAHQGVAQTTTRQIAADAATTERTHQHRLGVEHPGFQVHLLAALGQHAALHHQHVEGI